MPSPFPCSPVICECSWKKTLIEKKNAKDDSKSLYATRNARSCSLFLIYMCNYYETFVNSLLTWYPLDAACLSKEVFCENS